jgi:hypothetical protein
MKKLRLSVAILTVVFVGILTGCAGTDAKSPDVSDSIRTSLYQAGLKDVSLSQDRDKGIVTLAGQVASDGHKARAQAKVVDIGPIHATRDETHNVPLPPIAGAAALIGGIVLVAVRGKE